jgi:hypothetical protein
LSTAAFAFVAPLWRHDGSDGWYFLTLPEEVAEDVGEVASGQPRPFGTVPVVVTIGTMSWSTSLFADRKVGSYVLPVKAAVREAAGLAAGDQVECRISLEE